MWRYSSVMKDWQKRITSWSDLPFGIEVGAALAAAHRQAGQAVLEGLLEGEELEHALGDRGVEAQAALVGADGVVVLDPPAALDPDVAVVVLPADPEADDPVGLGHPPQDLVLVVLLLVGDEVEDVLGDLVDRLDELGLARVASLDTRHELLEANVIGDCHRLSLPDRAAAGEGWLACRPERSLPRGLRLFSQLCGGGRVVGDGGCDNPAERAPQPGQRIVEVTRGDEDDHNKEKAAARTRLVRTRGAAGRSLWRQHDDQRRDRGQWHDDHHRSRDHHVNEHHDDVVDGCSR